MVTKSVDEVSKVDIFSETSNIYFSTLKELIELLDINHLPGLQLENSLFPAETQQSLLQARPRYWLHGGLLRQDYSNRESKKPLHETRCNTEKFET